MTKMPCIAVTATEKRDIRRKTSSVAKMQICSFIHRHDQSRQVGDSAQPNEIRTPAPSGRFRQMPEAGVIAKTGKFAYFFRDINALERSLTRCISVKEIQKCPTRRTKPFLVREKVAVRKPCEDLVLVRNDDAVANFAIADVGAKRTHLTLCRISAMRNPERKENAAGTQVDSMSQRDAVAAGTDPQNVGSSHIKDGGGPDAGEAAHRGPGSILGLLQKVVGLVQQYIAGGAV